MISRKRKKTFRKKTFRKKTFRKKTFRKKKILKGGGVNEELHDALLRNSDLNIVKELIANGADPNATVNTTKGPQIPIKVFRVGVANQFDSNWKKVNEFLLSKGYTQFHSYS